jgi:hypothetical protein
MYMMKKDTTDHEVFVKEITSLPVDAFKVAA